MTQSAVQYKRVYIQVNLVMDADGRMMPRSFTWTNGKTYEIDKVLNVQPAHAQKAGGQGDRYTVLVLGRQKELFFEHTAQTQTAMTGRWFVEAKQQELQSEDD